MLQSEYDEANEKRRRAIYKHYLKYGAPLTARKFNLTPARIYQIRDYYDKRVD